MIDETDFVNDRIQEVKEAYIKMAKNRGGDFAGTIPCNGVDYRIHFMLGFDKILVSVNGFKIGETSIFNQEADGEDIGRIIDDFNLRVVCGILNKKENDDE